MNLRFVALAAALLAGSAGAQASAQILEPAYSGAAVINNLVYTEGPSAPAFTLEKAQYGWGGGAATAGTPAAGMGPAITIAAMRGGAASVGAARSGGTAGAGATVATSDPPMAGTGRAGAADITAVGMAAAAVAVGTAVAAVGMRAAAATAVAVTTTDRRSL